MEQTRDNAHHMFKLVRVEKDQHDQVRNRDQTNMSGNLKAENTLRGMSRPQSHHHIRIEPYPPDF